MQVLKEARGAAKPGDAGCGQVLHILWKMQVLQWHSVWFLSVMSPDFVCKRHRKVADC